MFNVAIKNKCSPAYERDYWKQTTLTVRLR